MVQPAPASMPPIWVGGGASEETLKLGAELGLDLMLPSSFGNPAQFAPSAEKYKEMYAAAGHPGEPRIGACWHLNVDKTSQRARERWEPRYRAYFELFSTILHRVPRCRGRCRPGRAGVGRSVMMVMVVALRPSSGYDYSAGGPGVHGHCSTHRPRCLPG